MMPTRPAKPTGRIVAKVGAVLVLVVWVAAVLLAGGLLGILGFGLLGQLRRLTAALAEAEGAVTPTLRRVVEALPGDRLGDGGGSQPRAES